jgi:hypothetical protein
MLLWLLGAIVFTAASVNVGMNLLKHTPERDLMLANVEALALKEEYLPGGLDECPAT